jgi:hypothetical protein
LPRQQLLHSFSLSVTNLNAGVPGLCLNFDLLAFDLSGGAGDKVTSFWDTSQRYFFYIFQVTKDGPAEHIGAPPASTKSWRRAS